MSREGELSTVLHESEFVEDVVLYVCSSSSDKCLYCLVAANLGGKKNLDGLFHLVDMWVYLPLLLCCVFLFLISSFF